MDLDFFSALSFLLIFLASVYMLLKTLRWSRSNENSHAQHLPPGPPKLPLIGNLHQLIGSNLIHRRLLELATRYGPIMHLQLGEVSTVVISSADAAKEVFKTHDSIFVNHPNNTLSKIIFYDNKNIGYAPYGGYWRQLRKICSMELLNRTRVESFRSVREEEVLSLVKSIAHNAGSVINLSHKLFSLTLSIVTRVAFGKRTKNEERLELLVDQIAQMASGFILADFFPSSKLLPLISGTKRKIQELFVISDRFLEDIVADHKTKQPPAEPQDLIDVLLRCELSMEQIKAVIMDIFIGGSNTSSTVMEWIMSELLKNPKIMEKAQAEIRQVYRDKGIIDEASIDELVFLKAIIKETLRLHPPGPLIPRESTESCEIYGYELPKRTKVIINAWAIARDSTFWADGESFNPERFIDCPIDFKGNNFEFVPFGAGKRICPGMYFALANVEFPLAMLLYHFDWNLPDGLSPETFDATEKFGAVTRKKHDLYLIPISHPCSSIQ